MNAQSGRNAYVDIDSPLPALPSPLPGADWIQVANRDALYHAVDLIELSVNTDTTITIAHDDRLALPSWLTKDFTRTADKITVTGQAMTLFTRKVSAATSLTFGPNTEDSSAKEAAMYLVFVSANSR
jgi:hypothetical protein